MQLSQRYRMPVRQLTLESRLAAPRPACALHAFRRGRQPQRLRLPMCLAAGPSSDDPQPTHTAPASHLKDVRPQILANVADEEDDLETFMTNQGMVEEVQTEDAKPDYFGESTEGNLHLVHRLKADGVINVLGLSSPDDFLSVEFDTLQSKTQAVLDELNVPCGYPAGSPHRGIHCNRTLNLRSIKAIGYDMVRLSVCNHNC